MTSILDRWNQENLPIVCLWIVSSQIWTIDSFLFQGSEMARKIFAAVGGGYASLFYGAGQVDRNSRWMCIATGVAYSENIVFGYDGTLPRHSPRFATMFLQIRNEPFHSYLLPIVDDCLHLIGFRNQTAVVTIQTIGPSHDHCFRPHRPRSDSGNFYQAR
jgi:hypothetical protein